jgi:hypothetical protein
LRDSKVDKWRRWCDGPIKDEVVALHLHRYTWQEVARLLRTFGDKLPASYYWRYMRDSYVVMQSVAVRRHADTDPRVISLGRLLKEISGEPDRITRQVIAGIWKPKDAWAERDLDRAMTEWAGTGGTHLDPSIPLADLDTLTAAASKISDYVDRHLAHSDSKPVPSTDLPSLDEMHAAIDVIGELFRKYYTLLTGADMAFLVPVLRHDWLAIFGQPWIPEGEDFFAKSPWEDRPG